MPRTAINLDDYDGQVHAMTLRDKLRVFKKLGSGSFGAAFTATLDGRALVVKLPVRLIARPRGPWDRTQGSALAEVLEPPDAVNPAALVAAREAFTVECQNAERVLDSALEGQLRRDRHVDAPGAPLLLRYETPETIAVIEAARRAHQSLPGYAHMHPILHFDAELPLLLSAPAQDTLENMYFLLGEDQKPSDEWFEAAFQLSSAIEFLRTYVQMAHLDVKPDNVLYSRDPRSGRPHIWLSDYGLMGPAGAPATFRIGTLNYKPDPDFARGLRQQGATCDQQQLYAYYATVLDMFRFPTANHHQVARITEFDVVSLALPKLIRERSALIQYTSEPSAELYHQLIVPLLEPSFGVLGDLFQTTRAWLQARVAQFNWTV